MELWIAPGFCDFPAGEPLDDDWFEEIPDEGYATAKSVVRGKYKVIVKR
jgi:hypothetical protein